MKADHMGAGEILLTSMDCDGTKAGYDNELTALVAANVSVPVIASGGAGTKASWDITVLRFCDFQRTIRLSRSAPTET